MSFPLATIILAAGKGSRMDSSLPKVLHKVGNKPMIEHVLQTAKHLKSSKIVTVLGYEQEIIRSFLQNQPIEVVIQSKQLGTAHAVLQCKTLLENFNGNILILYGDVPFIKMKTLTTLLQVHVAKKAESTILTTDLPNPFGYGRIVRNDNNNISKIIEEKDATAEERKIKEVNSGIYVFNSKKLFHLLPLVNNNNKQNEYYLPDVINLIIKENGNIAIHHTKDHIEIQGVNNLNDLAIANKIYENH